MDAKALHEAMQRAPHDGKPYRLARAALAALQPPPAIVRREVISEPGAAVEVTRLHVRPAEDPVHEGPTCSTRLGWGPCACRPIAERPGKDTHPAPKPESP